MATKTSTVFTNAVSFKAQMHLLVITVNKATKRGCFNRLYDFDLNFEVDFFKHTCELGSPLLKLFNVSGKMFAAFTKINYISKSKKHYTEMHFNLDKFKSG